MFKNIHAIAVYAADLGSAVTMYSGLGLELAWTEEAEGGLRVGLRCPQGGAELVLHDDPARQFTELTVAVADVHAVYETLRREPGYLWFEAPHRIPQGCAAFVRTPDGNVLSLLSPGCGCDARTSPRQEPGGAKAKEEMRKRSHLPSEPFPGVSPAKEINYR